jgi:integrase
MHHHHLVRTKSSPRWYVQWQEDGRARRVSTGTRSRAEAEAFLAAFRLEQSQRPTYDPSLPDVLDWYWESHGHSVARPDNIKLGIRYLKAFFGVTPASDIRLGLQQAFVAHRKAEGAGHESIRRDLSVLASALRRAEKYDRIDRAPPLLALAANPPRERYLSRPEVARLYRALRGKRQRHVLMFTRLAIATGARTTAMLELTWDRVDLVRGVIDYNVPGRRKTNKRRAVAPIEPHIVRALRHAKRHARCDYVISWAGKPIKRIAKAFIDQAKGVGLDDVTPHTLRHTAATWAAQRGVSLFLVGGLLGQTVVSTTARYAKYNPDALRQVSTAIRRKSRDR